MLTRGRRGTVTAPPYRARHLLRTSTAARLDFPATGALFQWADRLLALLENQPLLARLLARAAAESIVARVRDDFIGRVYNAFDMESAHRGQGARKRNEAALRALRAAHERLAEADMAGDNDARHDAYVAVHNATESLRNAVNAGRRPHKLSSGLFRTLTFKVLSALTDLTLLGAHTTATGVLVGVGRQDRLEQFETPSATEFALGLGPTGSKYKSLWRHLEFGTGVHRGAMPKAPTRYNAFPQANAGNIGASGVEGSTWAPSVEESAGVHPPGSWWYGKTPQDALVLRGSRGVHVLRDKHGKVHDDGAALAEAFGALLRHALRTTT